MADRIARHRRERGDCWRTIEEPLDLSAALGQVGPEEVAVVDCLTLWVSNLIHAERNVLRETSQLITAMSGKNGLLVSNEVGFGIVPDNALARQFRDEAGRVNQTVAAAADRVVLMVAGLPLVLKEPGTVMTPQGNSGR
jgi:adenosylcobinamide kinase/adenosylcobinamide-phosphate guanylyltransferase